MAANATASVFPQGFPASSHEVYAYLQESTAAWVLTGALAFFVYLFLDKSAVADAPNVPLPSFIYRLLPRIFSGTYYAWNARAIIDNGYRKFKDRAFKLVRTDVNMMFVPASAVQELSELPQEIASNIMALGFDLVGAWSGLIMLVDAKLHHHLVANKLNANLVACSKSVEDEVNLCMDEYFPKTDEWVEMKPYMVFMKMASRISSRVLIGKPWCHNKDWLEFSMNFTENVLHTIVRMRYFPTWMYPALSYILPSCWATKRNIQDAERILGPVFAQKLKEQDEGTYVSTSHIEPKGVEWLVELAKGDERDPIALVHSEILLALGSVHTSLFAEINFLYDLMANPEYIDILREEVQEVANQNGGWGKQSYSQLHKMDSALRESQRCNPPLMVGLRRIMHQDVLLGNGMLLPKGAYVCAGTHAIQQQATENPEKFDGLRSYRERKGNLASNKALFTTTEKTVLTWGLGKTACPGRWFASLALKTVFAKVLSDYEFKFLPSQKGRPQNDINHEVVHPDTEQKIMIRRRKETSAPF